MKLEVVEIAFWPEKVTSHERPIRVCLRQVDVAEMPAKVTLYVTQEQAQGYTMGKEFDLSMTSMTPAVQPPVDKRAELRDGQL